MTEYIVQDTSLTALANKIREKTGGSAPLEFPDEFVSGVGSLINPDNPPATPTDSILFYSITPFSLYKYNPNNTWTGSLEFSTDHTTWNPFLTNAENSAGRVNGWYVLYLRGSNNSTISPSNGHSFAAIGSGIKCVGNLNRLLRYNEDVTSIQDNAFNGMFYRCSNIDFDVELPATTVGKSAYKQMFYQCGSLTKAPALPATTIGDNCYEEMFSSCTALKTAPSVLPAMNLKNQCYARMFENCSFLETPPSLPATDLTGGGCYLSMFNKCNELNKLPELPAETLTATCYLSMFANSKKIKLSATQTGEYQTEYRIPSSGTGTADASSLTSMFGTTGGTFTGTPTINTTYYTSNTVIPAS